MESLIYTEFLSSLVLFVSNLCMLVKGKTSKKAKAEPTKEDVHAVIVDILKEVDFNTVSYYVNNTLIGWLKLCRLYDLIF